MRQTSISLCDEIYAILVTKESVKERSEWFGNQFEPLQVQRISYKKGTEIRAHYHILNPRTIKKTQEAFVVISGKLEVDIYDNNGGNIGSLKAGAGEAVLVYRGGHGIRITEDCIAYEIKAGQFSYVSEDKEYK